MSIFILAKFFSLMFSLISIVRLIPFTKGNRNTLIIRFFLCAANVTSVLFLTSSNKILPVIIIIITTIFTEGYEYLKKYISGNFIKLIRSDSFLLKLHLVLTFNTNAFGFLQMVKAVKAFDENDNAEGEEILAAYTAKVKNELNWVSNCLIFLSNIHQNKFAYSLLQSISIDMTKKNIPYQFLQIVIQLYCENDDFHMADYHLEYMETHYFDAQHKFTNIHVFLYYYAKGGQVQLFEKIMSEYPEAKNFPQFAEMRQLLISANKSDRVFREPKSYQFTIAKVQNNKILPLYIFSGIICLITLLQLYFSHGSSLSDRIFSGHIYPIEYIRFGAAARYLIFQGEWIRLITPVFLHGGLLHLTMNILGLINIGRVLLRFFDKYVLFFIFITGAIIGNVVSLFFSSALLSVGASGGVFSILGALLLYLIWHRREINKLVFQKIVVNFAVILAIQVIFGLQNSNIDNFAHLGGFAGGIVLTALSLWIRNTVFYKYYLNFVKIILFMLIISLMVFWPGMISENHFVKSELTNTVSESGLLYSIPDYWIKDSDRYLDPISNGQIIIYGYEGSHELNEQITAIKNLYTKDDKYKSGKERDLDHGWKSFEFNSRDSENSFDLYYFVRKENNQFTEVYLFLYSGFYDDYLAFFESVLYSMK